MFVNIGGIWLSSNRPETFTQAYHAGVIYALIENYLPNEQIPSLVETVVHFHALRELFGERLWQILKSRAKFRPRVTVYEMLTYQPLLPKSMIGSNREFCLGYALTYKKTKLKKQSDLKRAQDIETIIRHLAK